jgi:hypothetical protein
MCRDNAIAKLSGFIHTTSMLQRAEQLVARPELLNQGVFGICSSMVVLHVVMVHDPDAFVAYLHDSVFGRHAFLIYKLLEYYQEKSGVKLGDRVEQARQYLESLGAIEPGDVDKIARHIAEQEPHSLDYVIGRTLIEILATDPQVGRALYDDSRDWSIQYFASRTWAINQGDFAVKTNALQHLLRAVFDVASTIVGGASFDDKVQSINAQFDSEQRSFVLVAINGFSALAASATKREIMGRSFVRKPNTAEYTHWVAFTRKIEDHAYYYLFHFFSWGEIYSVRINKNVAGSYIADLVYGHF